MSDIDAFGVTITSSDTPSSEYRYLKFARNLDEELLQLFSVLLPLLHEMKKGAAVIEIKQNRDHLIVCLVRRHWIDVPATKTP